MAESELDRDVKLAIAELDAETKKALGDKQSSSAAGSAIGGLVGTLGSAVVKNWGSIFS